MHLVALDPLDQSARSDHPEQLVSLVLKDWMDHLDRLALQDIQVVLDHLELATFVALSLFQLAKFK